MRRVLLIACVLSFLHFCGKAGAEQPDALPTHQEDGEQIESDIEQALPPSVIDASTSEIVTDRAPAALPSQPAKDPAVNSWGNFRHPTPPAVGNTVSNYWLTQPPEGVIQHDSEPYEQTVASPDDVFFETACPPAIDLYRPDGLAPIGVIGDHLLNGGGQVLLSYRYSHIDLSGNRDGTSDVSTASVLGAFPIASTSQSIDRHLLQFEWGPTDDLTLMGTLPFYQISMNYEGVGGAPPSSHKTDPGDLNLFALYNLKRWDRHQLHLNLGFSAPVGLLDTTDVDITPTSPDFNYQMRVGSGTWDFLPGLTYRGQNECWTWGAQAMGTLRFGMNQWGYRLGNRADLTAWISRRVTERVSGSFRLDGHLWDNIHGDDARLNAALLPANQPGMQGGQRLDALFGVNYYIPDGRFPGQRLSVEGGVPTYQHLNGPQLKTNWLLTAGWQVMF